MKYVNRIFAFAAIVALVFHTSCGDDTPDPDTEPTPGQEITGTWAVMEEGDVTGEAKDKFSDFSITITATSSEVRFTTTGNGEALVFPSSGTFAVDASDNFKNGATVTRGADNVETRITLSEDGNILTMNFTINIESTSANGRVAGINGEYTFRLTKQS
ncbi:hypothetical protein PZB74_05400 [Porifericola rhodea]|uniref:hypothetical protein n=1 Tax=Porifericola rhodea TaxID=930972 RepID=UPI0026663D89|nr:hypothetical protein [Porifericola rhodea]WKN32780.1 hypothetical protein PZB74_05400 [Porifericola rhodea]